MPNIVFIHRDKRSERIDAANGDSVMQVATGHGVNEIVAECGGNAATSMSTRAGSRGSLP